MCFDETLDQRQAETETAVSARFRSVGLSKTLEYVRQESGRDSLSCILNADDGFFTGNLAANGDLAAG